jgi:F0F1-type ATP synthase membrane subunit b/b'
MPQFDFFSFSGQVFWTLSSFCFFYFIVLRFYLTRLSETLKMRQKLLSFSTKENKIKDAVVNIYDSFLSIMLKKN